jgi:hypothetical protein
MTSVIAVPDDTDFLNVDVDVWSKVPLDRVVRALANKVSVHYVGRERRLFSAHFALASSHGHTPDYLVTHLATLLLGLNVAERRLWQGALRRHFDLGIQAGHRPFDHQVALSPGSLRLVARLEASIVVTTYAAPEHSALSRDGIVGRAPSNPALQRTRVARR